MNALKRILSLYLLITAGMSSHAAGSESEVGAILDRHEHRGGFAVYVGEGNSDMVPRLSRLANYNVHGLSRNKSFVSETRSRLKEAGLYGGNSVEYWAGGELPYIENLVNLLVCEDRGDLDEAEILRVLAPNGLALFREKGGWEELRKPLNPETDSWPQYLHGAGNNPVSRDKVVGPPRHLQWRGSPRWGRFHEKMSSFAAMVSTGGRVFYLMDEGPAASIFFPADWQLTARDAYNGTVLWKRPIDNWVNRFWPYKAGPSTVPRRLVASNDALYVTLGIAAPISKLSLQTGKTLATYAGTERTDEMVLSGDILLVVVRDEHKIPTNRDSSGSTSGNFWVQDQKARLVALDPGSGKTLWEMKTPIAPLTMAADDERVYLCDYQKVLCLDRLSGKLKWASDEVPIASNYPSGYAPRLVVKNGIVLFAGSENVMKMARGSWKTPSDALTAFASETGKKLWTADHPASGFQTPEDIFVINGTVWFGETKDGNSKGTFFGLDLKTGDVKSSFVPDNNSYWFHQRCYPQKATEKYILASRTGLEFIDPLAEHWELNHWIRGGCTYGVMPANGLTYTPAHPCACYPESKLSGMNAVAEKQRYSLKPDTEITRLTKGSAYDSRVSSVISHSSTDWPCYRHDMARSSHAPVRLSGSPNLLWNVKAGENLSSPIAAGGRLFAADKDAHTVFAMNTEDGGKLWEFTAGGRIDSPPAYAFGRIVFGSRDGYVYCLDATDGALCWRYLAAPRDKRLCNFEQLESVWPVFGSVLVIDKTVYLTAGRSLFLDGGITFSKLDLETGSLLAGRRWDQRDPNGTDYHQLVSTLQKGASLAIKGYGLTMPPANNDVLSSNGKNLFMTSQKLTLDGRRVMTIPGARNEGNADSHIFSPTGLLDGSWWHRSYQAYGNAVEGGYPWAVSLKHVISGKILCADDTSVYAFGRTPKYYRWTLPLEFSLFSAPKAAKTAPSEKAKGSREGAGAGSGYNWNRVVPVWVRALFVTEDTLFICGPRDLYDEETISLNGDQKLFALQQEHAEGKHGSLLKLIDKNDGKEISTMELSDMPTWDGMITAGGKVFMTTVSGHVLCFEMK